MNVDVLSFEGIAERAGWLERIEKVSSSGVMPGMVLELPESNPRWLEADRSPMSPKEVCNLAAATYQFFGLDSDRSSFLWQDDIGGPVQRLVWFGVGLSADPRFRCPDGHEMASESNYGPGLFGGGFAADVDRHADWFRSQWTLFAETPAGLAATHPLFVIGSHQVGRCLERCGWLSFDGGFAAHPTRASRWLDHPGATIPYSHRPPVAERLSDE